MRRIFFAVLAAFLFGFGFVGCGDVDEEVCAEPQFTNITVKYEDSNVQSIFDLTNEFRTGNEAYYWNEDNSTKTSLVGKLSALTLDEDLCKAAAIRAKELVNNFAHTRPNGTSCFTVLDELGISRSAAGENIAAGQRSGESAFTAWKEDDKNYSGQGHRRNMLGENFTKIGIAYAYCPDAPYRYYWCMILAN